MTRILILGASGLIGHKLFEKLTERFGDVYGVLHRDSSVFAECDLFDSEKVIDNVDVRDFEKLIGMLHVVNPDIVLNCVGITRRRPEVNDPIQAINVNSLFPHRLANWAQQNDKRVIHFSTDCVFDGSMGDYTEESPTTGPDEYGRTKALGEIRYDHTLTIRSSFIGRELDFYSELLEWLLSQDGKTIKGFTNALYTGVSTIYMSQIVGDIIESHPDISGLHQLSTPTPISKYDLLCLARDAFGLDIEIIPDDGFVIKPTLDGSLLREKMQIKVPSWSDMMAGLAAETLYEKRTRATERSPAT